MTSSYFFYTLWIVLKNICFKILYIMAKIDNETKYFLKDLLKYILYLRLGIWWLHTCIFISFSFCIYSSQMINRGKQHIYIFKNEIILLDEIKISKIISKMVSFLFDVFITFIIIEVWSISYFLLTYLKNIFRFTSAIF